MRSVSGVGRVAAVGAVIAAIALVAIILFGGSSAYTVKARFVNAGQLVRGNPVQSGGVPVGSVGQIKITDQGEAEVTLKIKDRFAPLRQGTRATIRQFSLSGIANRYVDLRLPDARNAQEIADGGTLSTDKTQTAVDLDELFNTLDPETRKALQGFFQGQARQFRGRGAQANAGLRYLNPSLSTARRLFNELTRDTPLLERFLVDSSRLVTALAERRDDLAGLVSNLNETTRALGNQKAALADSIAQLPPFMRRANTTFVNLRSALDSVDPLVDASKPVAKKLGPFLSEARRFAAGAKPTIRDLSITVRRRGRANDLIDFVNSVPPLTSIALDTRRRSMAPGGRRVSVGAVRGAFPEAIEAFREGAPEIAYARPYTTDFLGWFDDFATTGGGYDAYGSYARGQITFFEGFLGTQETNPDSSIRTDQYRRCPGGADARAADGSNILSAAEQEALDCTEAHRAVGP